MEFGSSVDLPRVSNVGLFLGVKGAQNFRESGILMFGRRSKHGGYFINFFVVLTVMRGATVKVICQVLSDNMWGMGMTAWQKQILLYIHGFLGGIESTHICLSMYCVCNFRQGVMASMMPKIKESTQDSLQFSSFAHLSKPGIFSASKKPHRLKNLRLELAKGGEALMRRLADVWNLSWGQQKTKGGEK